MEIYRDHPHRPPHLFLPHTLYMVTGATLDRQWFLDSDEKKAASCQVLFQRIERYQWELEAWAVMPNHYHFVARAPEDACSLKRLIRSLHSQTANYCNKVDEALGRQLWYNYWDTCITSEGSYLARLHYVHTNPVKHGLVKDPLNYPFCSYRRFVEQEDPEFVRRVLEQPCDGFDIVDDF
jgi:putative transposase